MEKTMTVEQILEKESSDGKKFFVLREGKGANGTGYFLWQEKLPEGVVEGCQVKIAYSDGKYPRISSLEVIEPTSASHAGARDERMSKAVALKAAAQVHGSQGSEDSVVLGSAEKYLSWLNRRA